MLGVVARGRCVHLCCVCLPTAGAGVLAGLDGFMNIAMEQTEEYVNGQLKNKYGDCFIRGNNGACVPPPSPLSPSMLYHYSVSSSYSSSFVELVPPPSPISLSVEPSHCRSAVY